MPRNDRKIHAAARQKGSQDGQLQRLAAEIRKLREQRK